MLTIKTIDSKGIETMDLRPGHTITGLMYYKDPFQKYSTVPLRRVSMYIERVMQA